MFYIFLTTAIIVSILGFIANKLRKKRMEIALGREVRDSELTSLTSWMNVAEKEDSNKEEQT